MNKLRLWSVVLTVLFVGMLVMAAGAGVWRMSDTETLAGNSTGLHSDETDSMPDDSDDTTSMTVKNVSVRNQTENGVVYLDIAVTGDLNTKRLGWALERMYDDPTVNVSSMELVEAQESVATVAIATDGRSSSTHIIRRVKHYLENTNWNKRPLRETNDPGSATANGVCESTTAYYQVDFVVGEPIEELRGPEGTYLPHELIRFAHGSTDEPIVRRSDGEFITHEILAERIESHSIEVENGVATVTFSIVKGAKPVKLSLVSYTKPGPGWSRAREHLQEFVDADTETFETGGSYTLRVSLPEAETRPCKPIEKTPAPTSTPTPTPTVEKTLDLRVGGSQSFEFAPVVNGERYGETVRIENIGSVPGRYLCITVANVGGSENGLKEPEGDTGVHDRPGSDLPQYLDVTIAIHHPHDGGPANTVYSSPLTNTGTQCVKLQEPLTDDGATLRVVVIVAEENISNAMSDTVTFDIELTLYAHDPNEE